MPQFRASRILFLLVVLLGAPFARADELRFRETHFKIPLSSGTSLGATLRLPVIASPGEKIPAILVFGGFESAAHVLDLVHPRTPVALASFDYPFSASRNLEFPGSLKALPEAKRVFPETVEGIVALARLLRARPGIDPERIILIGASFGAPFAVAAAAQEPAITGLAIVHGFGLAPVTAENILLKTWLPRYGWIARPMAWLLSRSLWLILGVDDPETFARRLSASQRVLMITAREDSFIPRKASDSLWKAIEESRAQATRELMPGDHLLPGSDRLIEEMMRRIQAWILRFPGAWQKF